MPIVRTTQTGTERIEGAEHGATISLIRNLGRRRGNRRLSSR